MELSEKIDILRKSDLLSKAGDEALSRIANDAVVREFRSGDVVFKEHDQGDAMYFIHSGSVAVVKETNDGKEMEIAALSAGDNFGEMAILLTSYRSSSVRAREDCVLLELHQQPFQQALQGNIEISLALNRLLTTRLASTLNIVAKKDNYSAAFLFPDDSKDKADQLLDYLRRISSKGIRIVDLQQESLGELDSAFNRQNTLIIAMLGASHAHLAGKFDFAVNFRGQEEGQFHIPRDANPEKVEKIGRIIAHKTIGIALGSGAVPAMAHLGVLKMLHDEKIPLDFVAGCSAGSWCGAAYACGYPFDVIYKNFRNFETMMAFPPRDIAFKKSGIFSGNSFGRILPILKNRNVEDCKIPFASVATDLLTGAEIVIDKGPVLDAIRASSSIPIFFNAFERGDCFLVDGVVTTPVPISVLEKKNIDIKICSAISQLDLQGKEINKNCGAITSFFRAKCISANMLSIESEKRADVVIRPDVAHIGIFETKKIMEAIEIGEAAGRAVIGRVKRLLYNA